MGNGLDVLNTVISEITFLKYDNKNMLKTKRCDEEDCHVCDSILIEFVVHLV